MATKYKTAAQMVNAANNMVLDMVEAISSTIKSCGSYKEVPADFYYDSLKELASVECDYARQLLQKLGGDNLLAQLLIWHEQGWTRARMILAIHHAVVGQ